MISVDISLLLGMGMFLTIYLKSMDDVVKKLYIKIDDLGEKLNTEILQRDKLSKKLNDVGAELWALRLDLDKLS